MMRQTQSHVGHRNPFWTEEENIEMTVRVLVRKDFSDLLGNILSLSDLGALEDTLFHVVYPSIDYR